MIKLRKGGIMELTIGQAKKLIASLDKLNHPRKPTIMLVGIPGIGKTAIIEQVAKEHGKKAYNVRTSLIEGPDLTGIYDPKIGDYVAPVLPKADEPAIINIDEPNRGMLPSIQAAFRIIEGRGTQGFKYNPKIHTIVSCVNPESEADVIEMLGEAFISRVHVIHVRADMQEWVNYAVENGINEKIIQFLLTYEKYFCRSNTIENVREFKQVPNPRNWERASIILNLFQSTDIRIKVSEIIEGSVGPEAAVAFDEFLRDPEPPVTAKQVLDGLEDKYLERYKKHQAEDLKHKALATIYDTAYTVEMAKDVTSKGATGIARMLENTTHKEFVNAFFRAINRTPSVLDKLIRKKELQKAIKTHLEDIAKLNEEIKKLMGGNNE
jgi:hypothetical protein